MKKFILGTAVFAIMGLSASAQTFDLGLKAGVNVAKLNADFATEENRVGYQIGAWARVGSNSLYLQPELYFGSKGNKFIRVVQDNGTEVSAEGSVRFTTLDIPVLIGKKFGGDNFNFRLNAGPVVSFNLNEDSSFSAAFDQATDFKNYKNQAFALQFGGGIDISNVTLDVRYETGLTNISQSERYKQKPNVFQVSLGFKIF